MFKQYRDSLLLYKKIPFNHSMTFSVSYERFPVNVIIEYVVIKIFAPIGLSFASEVNLQIVLSSAVDHILNWVFHCSTDTPELHKIKARLLTVQAAVTPTKVLPAPQGKTMIPLLALPLPNIFLKLFSWYGRKVAFGLKSISMLGMLVSLRKSYSAKSG